MSIRLWLTVAVVGTLGGVAVGQERRDEGVYVVRAIGELEILEGVLPGVDDARRVGPRAWLGPGMAVVTDPRATLDGAGEIYLDRPGDNERFPRGQTRLGEIQPGDVVAIRLPEAREEVTGTLYAPRGDSDDDGMVAVRFRMAGKGGGDGDRRRFQEAKVRHFRRQIDSGLPGAAWFDHRARETGLDVQAAQNQFPNRNGDTGIERTYSLFSGGRAINENLQLDRELVEGPNAANAGGRVRVDSIRGITVAEIDWTARLAGKEPKLDPLASNIPADQHALFVPSLKAAGDLLEQYRRWGGLPALQLAMPTSEDQGTQAFYERQLGLALGDLRHLADLQTIRSLAATGSDPYLPSGTDLAILFETSDPQPLLTLLRDRMSRMEKVEPVEAEVGGLPVFGAYREDRRVSAFVVAIDKVVVLTNSQVQLQKIVAASQGKAPSLASLPEYRFFRDRYTIGEGGESAFLMLSDATIRRWCGPGWRIGSSRRMRAAAELAQIQADHLGDVVTKADVNSDTLKAPEGAIDLGVLQWVPDGVASSYYGTMEFQTPIAEMDLDEVSQAEADAYERWRDGYERNWRGVFDPIALRIVADGDRLAADVSILPLIVGSDYRGLVELVGAASLEAGDGDAHPEALAHAVVAIDHDSGWFRMGDQAASNLFGVPGAVGLSWLGDWATLYLDADPFWAELAKAENAQQHLTNAWPRIPLAVEAEVRDGAKLALFLTALRAYIDRTAPDTLEWTNLSHGDRSYVRITSREMLGSDTEPLRLYYATTPKALCISLNESMIHRFLDRHAEGADPDAKPQPWLGESLAMRVDRDGLRAFEGVTTGADLYRDQMRLQSWSNLPILNEWKRIFPDLDPVVVHATAWGVRPVCPGGGEYVWNEDWQTMESTAFGHPGQPKPGPDVPSPLTGVAGIDFGVTFGDGGLRGRVEVEASPKP